MTQNSSHEISQQVSHYRILDKLGKGGMSEVYLAEDTKLNRRVALKFLLPELLGHDRSRKRLIREAKAVASLDHPNICSIYEVDEDADQSFIVMQYVEGETLATRIAAGETMLPDVIAIAVQVAAALSEAHSHGIIHRDIKPHNIMVTARGLVKVLDFGLSKVVFNDGDVDTDANTLSMLSDPGSVLGTVPYLSPEQSRSEDLDVRSDIFSFGTVLYEMVSGRHPFARNHPTATMLAISTESPPPLARYAVDVPPELDRIVQKCLEKSPERRYQSAAELFVDLDHLRRTLYSDASIAVQSYTPWPSRSFWQRHPYYLHMLAAALMAIAIGCYLYWRNSDAPAPITSVVVLPFYYTNEKGITEETKVQMNWISESIANSLQELPTLKKVIAPYPDGTSGNDAQSPQAAGKKYGVQAVLTGRFEQIGDEIRIQIRLTDAADGKMLGGQQYPFSKANGSAIREQICAQIVADLQLKLTPEDRRRLSQAETQNADAAIEYQKGRDCWYKRDVQNIKASISYYGRSLEIDPLYAKAHAGLADSYAVLAGSEEPSENAKKARVEAEKALSLDSRLAEAYTSLGIVAFKFDWDWSNVETKLSKAIQLKSNSADAHYWYAAYLAVMGRRDESIAESRRAAELDPLNSTYRLNVARMLYVARRDDNALVECKEAIRLNPTSGVAYVYLGYLYREKGQYDQALAEFQHALTLTSDQWYIKSAIGTIYAMTGRKQEAKKILEELIPKARPIYVAQLQIALGEKDEAFASLEQAYLERADSLGFLNVDPSYDPIRSDPRFSDLVHRVGLPAPGSRQ